MAAEPDRVATLDGVLGAEGLGLHPLGGGRLLVLAGGGEPPAVWDLADPAAPRRLPPPAAAGDAPQLGGGGGVHWVAVPAGGAWALVLSRDGRWERVSRDGARVDGGALASGEVPLNLQQLRVADDGLAVAYDYDGARVRAWRVPSGRELDWSSARLRAAGGHAVGLALLDGGRALVCGNERDAAVRVYEVAAGGDGAPREVDAAGRGLALDRSLADRPRPLVAGSFDGGAYAAVMACRKEWLLSDGRRSAFVRLDPPPGGNARREALLVSWGSGLAAAVCGGAVHLAEPARLRQAADAVAAEGVRGVAVAGRDGDRAATLAVQRLDGRPVEVWRVPLRAVE